MTAPRPEPSRSAAQRRTFEVAPDDAGLRLDQVLARRIPDHSRRKARLVIELGGVFIGRARAKVTPIEGRAAVSHVSVLRVAGAVTILRSRLETGRTHQVRIHLLGIGHPVCGDPRYGERGPAEPPRLVLHATRLGFVHPTTGAALRFDSPWPKDLAGWASGL